MTEKQLQKLIKTCRKLGVKSYKGDGFEFTLSDNEPIKSSRKKQSVKSAPAADNEEFESDSLTTDQLLMWSASGGGVSFPGEQEA